MYIKRVVPFSFASRRLTDQQVTESDQRLSVSSKIEQDGRLKALENELAQERSARAQEQAHFENIRRELATLQSHRFVSDSPFRPAAEHPMLKDSAPSLTSLIPPFPSFRLGGQAPKVAPGI